MLNKNGFDAHITKICVLVDERNRHIIPAKWMDANLLLEDAINSLWGEINE